MRRLDVARELIRRRGFLGFVQYFWQYADPNPYVHNWHVDALCDYLESFRHREFSNLVINIPPRMGKSLIVDCLYHAWLWAHDPSHPIIATSYDTKLCLRDAAQMVDVCTSHEYQRLFPQTKVMPRSAMSYVRTSANGRRFSTTPRGKATGHGCKTLSCNDPLKAQEAHSETALEDIENWWFGTMMNRRSGRPEEFGAIVTMQRLAETDLAGACLEKGYEHLCLPMVYTPTAMSYDRRSEPGELLFPQVWGQAAARELQETLDPAQWDAQYQQNPQNLGGGYVKPEWLEKHWTSLPTKHRKFLKVRQYWDFNSKGKKKASHSRCAGIVCAAFQGKIYLLDWTAGYWDYPTAKEQFQAVQDKQYWSWASEIKVEDKANGTPLLQELNWPHLCAWEPGALSKEERLSLESNKLKAGVFYFPDHRDCSEYKQELTGFPTRKPNDLVDVTVMALNDLIQASDLRDAWRKANQQAALAFGT